MASSTTDAVVSTTRHQLAFNRDAGLARLEGRSSMRSSSTLNARSIADASGAILAADALAQVRPARLQSRATTLLERSGLGQSLTQPHSSHTATDDNAGKRHTK